MIHQILIQTRLGDGNVQAEAQATDQQAHNPGFVLHIKGFELSLFPRSTCTRPTSIPTANSRVSPALTVTKVSKTRMWIDDPVTTNVQQAEEPGPGVAAAIPPEGNSKSRRERNLLPSLFVQTMR